MKFNVGDKVILTSYQDDMQDSDEQYGVWLRDRTVLHITEIRDSERYPYCINETNIDIGDEIYAASESELTLYDGKSLPKPKVIKSWLLK